MLAHTVHENLVDFSSASNVIILKLLDKNLTQFILPNTICQRITDFLSDRQQNVRFGKTCQTWHTPGTFHLLFSLRTNDFTVHQGHHTFRPHIQLWSVHRQNGSRTTIRAPNPRDSSIFSIQQPCKGLQRAHLSVKSAEFFKYLGPITPCNLNWDNTNCITKNDSANFLLHQLEKKKNQSPPNSLDAVLHSYYQFHPDLLYNCLVGCSSQRQTAMHQMFFKEKKKKKNYQV